MTFSDIIGPEIASVKGTKKAPNAERRGNAKVLTVYCSPSSPVAGTIYSILAERGRSAFGRKSLSSKILSFT